ncbi:Autophagy-related protein 2 [Komagataella phaffii CBS 7435]|uniref:Autophagy-related protein 2 n=2 Tax=Komagataella phaffii TaxID=460519 RepID=C4QVF7_KOMPG|nr:Peripheral membrane protein required for vesicle formation [Komagataella phaffii GS115]AOA61242.1 GQ67_02422T0 [Komagataella phaffii]CAH2445886.1 Autophagy-related protein 2 [Komagataella phaffii CBS 7435]AOA65566.1 GQ68_02825T0 [Komagataella phaffii GS115]CAY67230.1 Peripheral membrane protein required for vesicle formation [Komagataella phaffii GS115]CCA36337.2 Autophagy-related protein 2 [Komagataella phaffii CBS 7435]
MAAWMPQNIQKRLLRYVLQQLSLFAEIDLPNLDVSLGTNSKVHLKELQLDPDKVDIPNFYLRNGVVDDMDLTLTLSNGVNIEATGVNLTLAPSMTNGVDFDPGKLSFSLYQSTADLATSVFFVDQDNNELPKTDKELDDEHDSSKNVANDDDSSPLADKENPKQPSKMGNMMAKAVEMALSRLQVQLKDINLTIITDESTFQICIEEASFDTTDGVRKIEFKGAELSVLKPSVYPGDQPQGESQDDSEDDDSVDESSSFDSHPTDFMSSSFIGSREELENSMLNSQSSVYMSATSKLLTKPKHSTRHPSETKPSVTLGHVNEGTLTFEGLQSFENVSIIIDQIHVAVSPIPESLTALLETLSKRLKILRVHSAKSKTSNTTTYTFSSKDGLQEEPEFSDQISTSSSTGFKELKINEIVISLNSALGKNGAFAIDNSLCLSIESLELAMVSEGNLSGTLKTLKMNKSETSEVFSFQPGSNYDVRFEMILDDDNDLYNITILCPKPGVFNLNEEVLNHLLSFCSKIPSTLHSLQSYQYQKAKLASLSNPQSNSNNDQENEIYLQTASFEFILQLTSSDKVKLTSFPLSFNSNTGVIEVERIVVERKFKENQVQGDPPSQDRFKMQPHKSTNSGCLTCRKRQVKCDERKPFCLNCEKSEQKCTGFTHLSKDLPSSSSSLSSDDSYKSILLINGLKTYLFKKPKKVKTFDKSGIQCSYLSPNASEIELIELEMTMSDFTSLIDSLELFFEQLKVVNHPKMDIAKEKTVFRTSFNSRNPVRNPRALGSQTGAMFSHSSLVSFLRINSVSFLLKEALNGFGDVSGRIKSINCNFHVKGFQDFFVGSLDVARIHKLSSQLILEKVDAPGNKKPMLIARLKSSSLTIQLADCLAHYYGEWFSFLHQCNMKEREIVKRQEDIGPKDRARDSNNFVISLHLNNIIIELNPVSLKSKAVLFIKKGCGTVTFGSQRLSISSSLTEITPLLIDDTKNLKNEIKLDSKNSHPLGNSFLLLLMDMGYISMGMLSSVSVSFETESSASLIAPVNVNVMCDTLRLDICADSLQCLLNLIKDLRQPIIVPFEQKYRTQPETPLDALKDVDFDAFLPQKTKDSNNVAATKTRTFSETALNGAFRPKVYSDGSLEIIDNYYEHESVNQGLDNRTYGDLEVFEENSEDDISLENSLNMKHDHFYHTSFMDNTRNTEHVPFKLNLSVEAVYIRLFDGYDWKETRVSILNAVRRVEAKAAAELSRIEKIRNTKLRRDSSASNSGNEGSLQTDDDSATSGSVSEPVIEETLYQSIHLSLPVGMEPTLLAERVNNDVNFKRASSDSLDKTQSPSSVSSKSQVSSPQTRRLKLKRSTFHKVALELRNLSITFKLLSSFDPTTIKNKSSIRNPNSAEIVNRISVEVDDFLITDNIPTSTWKTFVTYLKEAGSRELNSKMVHLDIATIRPTRLLATTEMRIETNVLPLRLYVDQDTLDFLTRFGEFKDLRFVPQVVDDDDLFVSKLHVFPVRLKLDYKPKTVDYAGIRSGKTSEFMNFFILDEASMVLRDVVLYGVKITKLNPILNGIWTPDITRNQLKGVLSGLASINSVVKISSGFKDLIAIPMEEYRRDGRLITGVRKGAFSFAKTTGNELLKLGVKLVAGTQTILENTEQVLGGEGNLARMPVQVKERKQRRDSDEGNFYVITDRQTYERNLKKTSMNESIIGKTSLREANRFDEEYDDDDDDEDDLVNKIKPHLRNTMLDSQLFLDDNEIEDEYEEQETDESQKTISLYANQPTTMKEGLQLAYQSFGRNIDSAKRAISKASSKVSEDNRTSNIAYEVMKATPVVVLRPIIGTTEAVSKALLGGLNQFDPDNRSKSEDKYKQ